MKNFWKVLVIFTLAVFISGASRGTKLVKTGDANNTRTIKAGFSAPHFTAVPPDATPGWMGYIDPTDGANKCEGTIAIQTAAGVRCMTTEEP